MTNSSVPSRMSIGMRFAVVFAAVVALEGTAVRAESADAKRGRIASEKWCAGCHIVSDSKRRQASDTAPTFVEIANDPKLKLTGLRGILLRPHGRMPTGVLTRRDVDDVLAYFLSLRKKKD